MRGIAAVIRAVLEGGETGLNEFVSSRVAREIVEALVREGYEIEAKES